MKCHHHSGSVERFWWVVYISAARLNLGSGESSLSTYCSYYWTPWWFWNFLATGKKINRDLSGFWLKDSKKLNIRGISKSIRHFICHSTTSQRWPVPVGPQVFVIAKILADLKIQNKCWCVSLACKCERLGLTNTKRPNQQIQISAMTSTWEPTGTGQLWEVVEWRIKSRTDFDIPLLFELTDNNIPGKFHGATTLHFWNNFGVGQKWSKKL